MAHTFDTLKKHLIRKKGNFVFFLWATCSAAHFRHKLWLLAKTTSGFIPIFLVRTNFTVNFGCFWTFSRTLCSSLFWYDVYVRFCTFVAQLLALDKNNKLFYSHVSGQNWNVAISELTLAVCKLFLKHFAAVECLLKQKQVFCSHTIYIEIASHMSQGITPRPTVPEEEASEEETRKCSCWWWFCSWAVVAWELWLPLLTRNSRFASCKKVIPEFHQPTLVTFCGDIQKYQHILPVLLPP